MIRTGTTKERKEIQNMAKTNLSKELRGFWKRVDDEIYQQKRTKTDVAEKCNFDRKVLSIYGNMSVAFLARLCKELNISADYLLFGNDWETEVYG